MKYENTIQAIFHSRPNRFIAKVFVEDKSAEDSFATNVLVEDNLETVHVKNTGRCKELLFPGVKVILEISDNPNRKTKYDLIAVYKENLGWVNIDSQAPNKVVLEWLQKQDYTYIKPEYKYGASRFDFYMERNEEKYLLEVKGCTLEIDGIGYFPDAPTERGIKHLKELSLAAKEGYHCMVAFVIQMEGILEVRPNIETHPEFGVALEEAKNAGVEILFLCCKVTENTLDLVASPILACIPHVPAL